MPISAKQLDVMVEDDTSVSVLARQAHEFQSEVGSLIEPSGVPSPSALSAIQSLDEMTHKLECISSYLKNLSALAPNDWQVDIQTAVADIQLEELKGRLSGTFSSHSNSAGAAQDCDFF